MKGSLSIEGGVYAESLLNEQLIEGQLSEITRKYLFGKQFTAVGKSSEVIFLEYDRVVKYFEENFTMENSVFFTHGDMSPVPHIEAFSEFLCKVPAKRPTKPNAQVETEILPKTVNLTHLEGLNNFLLLSYKIQTESLEELIHLNILSCLLFDFPESPFSKYLTPSTPYPKFYGFREYCFNIGFTTPDQIGESSIVHHQKNLQQDLENIVESNFNDGFVEAVLNNLESSYHTNDGFTLLQNISSQLSTDSPFLAKLNIRSIFKSTHLLTQS